LPYISRAQEKSPLSKQARAAERYCGSEPGLSRDEKTLQLLTPKSAIDRTERGVKIRLKVVVALGMSLALPKVF
jgi:hypothetical protein